MTYSEVLMLSIPAVIAILMIWVKHAIENRLKRKQLHKTLARLIVDEANDLDNTVSVLNQIMESAAKHRTRLSAIQIPPALC